LKYSFNLSNFFDANFQAGGKEWNTSHIHGRNVFDFNVCISNEKSFAIIKITIITNYQYWKSRVF